MKKLMLATAMIMSSMMIYADTDSKTFHSRLLAQFGRMDINKNDKLSLDEMVAFHQKRFVDIDKNLDGQLSRGELKTYHKHKQFKRADTNGDNMLTKKEYLAHLNKKKGHMNKQQSHPKKWFKRVDVNQDNVLTDVEMQAFYQTRFGKIDANNDGQVTMNELSAYKADKRASKGHDRCRLASA